MKIYHNTMCSKSRGCYSLLEDQGIEFETIEYLKTPMAKEELSDLLSKLNISAHELIRKGEAVYVNKYKDQILSEDEWIDVMIKYPVLIQRPIVVKGNKAVIGRPIKKVIDLLINY